MILPLGIIVPIIATKIWHNTPLQLFMTAYKLRVTLVPIFDVLMLLALKRGKPSTVAGLAGFWGIIVLATACSAIVNSMQFNAQMSFFAKRVDPAIGGSYMTLLNTAANLGMFETVPTRFVLGDVQTCTELSASLLFNSLCNRRYMASFLRNVACWMALDRTQLQHKCVNWSGELHCWTRPLLCAAGCVQYFGMRVGCAYGPTRTNPPGSPRRRLANTHFGRRSDRLRRGIVALECRRGTRRS